MASIADIRERRKFFVRKKNYDPNDLCEICRNHTIIMAQKISCDYFIFSNFNVTDIDLKNRQAIHYWCRIHDSPRCFRAYKDAGFVD